VCVSVSSSVERFFCSVLLFGRSIGRVIDSIYCAPFGPALGIHSNALHGVRTSLNSLLSLVLE
jgi:hypothetical protein